VNVPTRGGRCVPVLKRGEQKNKSVEQKCVGRGLLSKKTPLLGFVSRKELIRRGRKTNKRK